MRLYIEDVKHNPYHRTTKGNKADIKPKCQFTGWPIRNRLKGPKQRQSESVARSFLKQWGGAHW